MGARPGDFEDTSDFLLPNHEGLSKIESANKIADHFSQVSAEYLPLSVEKLPPRVLEKIKKNPESHSKVPIIDEYQIHKQINQPKSGVGRPIQENCE